MNFGRTPATALGRPPILSPQPGKPAAAPFSASCFVASYYLIFVDPVAAVMVGWLLAMVLRQIGHFIFEPKSYDAVNQVTHEYKESVKVGYNLRRKVILLSIWVAVPVVLLLNPSFFGLLNEQVDKGLLYDCHPVVYDWRRRRDIPHGSTVFLMGFSPDWSGRPRSSLTRSTSKFIAPPAHY
jgi:hypothetical protein